MISAELSLPVRDGYNPDAWSVLIAHHLGISVPEIKAVIPVKRSIDARGKNIHVKIKFDIYLHEDRVPDAESLYWKPTQVSGAREVHIIGSGPAGLFAALRLIELGFKPVIWERGKDVRARRFDLARLTKQGVLDENSNYCFGEGGAGTYSDGKLYTRSTKRGDVKRILSWLNQMGAPDEILYEAHPHIGTNKLPALIARIRDHIIACGGEVHFSSTLTGLKHALGKISAICINHKDWIRADTVLLATGHSARDIFTLLAEQKIRIEYKPFALGVRVEHPQSYIDEIRYKCNSRPEFLPAASYSWVEQVDDLGVYSFCMCPGGIIAPCATAADEVVTNGWSPSKRNNPYANSGIVVSVDEEKLKSWGTENPLRGMLFQKQVENAAWVAGGKNQFAPAQRLTDFCNGKNSNTLPLCSYRPGVAAVNLKEVLPAYIYKALAEAFRRTHKKMRGYLHEDAIVTAVESRTSSPVRIPRSRETGMHTEINGLFPCGEGAGFAGGIISAAIDGINQAEQIHRQLY